MKQIVTLVMGFLVICVGITILQLSKVNPDEFKGLDRKSTILLHATRTKAEGVGEDSEKGLAAVEDPGVDSVRGSFGALGSIVRARTLRKLGMSSGRERSAGAELRARTSRRHQLNADSVGVTPQLPVDTPADNFGGLKRHQLYDPPVSASPSELNSPEALGQIESPPSKRQQTIKFGERLMVHSYARVGVDDDRSAVHEYRDSNLPLSSVPPLFNPEDPSRKLPATSGLPLNLSHPEGLHPANPPKEHKRTGSGIQHLRSPAGKKYPKGNNDDDKEETESLWSRSGKQSDEDSEIALEESLKGIRLVTQSKP